MDKIKDVIVIVTSTLLGFFAPIGDFIVAILILMAVNFISGLLEDELNGTGWKGKKAFKAFTELFVLTGIGAFVYAMGHFVHAESESVACVSAVCYAAIYFYTRNIIFNWLKITNPDTTLHKLFLFLYWVVGFYFLEKVPGLKAYFASGQKDIEDKVVKEAGNGK
jgi:hypothetical protein